MASRNDHIDLYAKLVEGATLRLLFPNEVDVRKFRAAFGRYKVSMDEAFESVDLQEASARKKLSVTRVPHTDIYEVKLVDRSPRAFIVLETEEDVLIATISDMEVSAT